MSYSLKSFFPKDDDCTIHLLHDKKRSLCFVLHKNQSSLKYVCQIFDTNQFLKGLLYRKYVTYGDYLSSKNIGVIYRIGNKEEDLEETDLNQCFEERHYQLILKKTPMGEQLLPPIGEQPLGSGTYGSVYQFAKNIVSGTECVIKIYKQLDSDKTSLVNLDEEQKFSKKASEIMAGPHIFDMWVCLIKTKEFHPPLLQPPPLKLRFIVMEQYTITFYYYIADYRLKNFDKYLISSKIYTGTHYLKLSDRSRKYIEEKYEIPNPIMRQLVDQLARLSNLRIKHGDLSLSNIMLKFNEQKEFEKLAITDFGMASQHEYVTIYDNVKSIMERFEGHANVLLNRNSSLAVSIVLEPLTKLLRDYKRNMEGERLQDRQPYSMGKFDKSKFLFIKTDMDECIKNITEYKKNEFSELNHEPFAIGDSGAVYSAKDKDSKDIMIRISMHPDQAENLLNPNIKAIFPTIIEEWNCWIDYFPVQFIAMEKYTISLTNFINERIEGYKRALIAQLKEEGQEQEQWLSFVTEMREFPTLDEEFQISKPIIDAIIKLVTNMQKALDIPLINLHNDIIMLKFKDGEKKTDLEKVAIVEFTRRYQFLQKSWLRISNANYLYANLSTYAAEHREKNIANIVINPLIIELTNFIKAGEKPKEEEKREKRKREEEKLNALRSLYSFLKNIAFKDKTYIEGQYAIGDDTYDLDDNNLAECFSKRGYEISKNVPPLSILLNSGSYGSVYLLITKDDQDKLHFDEYVVKIYISESPQDKMDDEQVMAIRAGNDGIGPKVIQSWGCTINESKSLVGFVKTVDLRFIVMEKYDITLRMYLRYLISQFAIDLDQLLKMKKLRSLDFLEAEEKSRFLEEHVFPREITEDIKKKLSIMREKRILHNDLHLNNMMLRFNNKQRMKEFESVIIIDFGRATYYSETERYLYSLSNISFFLANVVEMAQHMVKATKFEKTHIPGITALIMKPLLDDLKKERSKIKREEEEEREREKKRRRFLQLK